MKLRFNYTFKDLAYSFHVSEPSASNYFYMCLRALYFILQPLIKWSNEGALSKMMPKSFRKNYVTKYVSILDCFEIFTEVPDQLDQAALLYSFYKHHHTVKFLICKKFKIVLTYYMESNFFFLGIVPQGSVSFISCAYPGRCSDKFITNDSKVLDFLNPGDVISRQRISNRRRS